MTWQAMHKTRNPASPYHSAARSDSLEPSTATIRCRQSGANHSSTFAGPRGAISVVRAFCMATGRVPVHIFDVHLIAQIESG